MNQEQFDAFSHLHDLVEAVLSERNLPNTKRNRQRVVNSVSKPILTTNEQALHDFMCGK